MGPEAPDGSNQTHDFDPGLDNGLFWTVPVPAGSISADPGKGRASLVVENLEMEDYFTVGNALTDGSSNPATVSFQVHWSPGLKRTKVRDQATGMAGEFVLTTATMAWSVSSAGQAYLSDPENTSSSISGQIGHERNGVFFP
ncbi:MAG TPA: hypothetical protein VJV74_11670 [Terriglobia bacterium]|nr:hypothetical protein [Terriglobia bacterium]